MKAWWRSLLFVPADDERRIGKAAGSEADAVILDLEDGVSIENKAAARQRLPQAIETVAAQGKTVLVRVDSDNLQADMEAALHPLLSALMLPKVEDVTPVQIVSNYLDSGSSNIGILPLIESPRALPQLEAILLQARVVGLALGSEDFSLALGVPPTPACLDLPSRMIALAAAAHGKAAIAIPFSLAAFRDLDGFRDAALLARSFGATGGLCIHPAQVDVVNGSFRPSQESMDQARAIAAAWEKAEQAGQAVISLDGQMIDRPVALRAARLLSRFG
jgi:citrate lyase subunit beta / citryl-CoA lyase